MINLSFDVKIERIEELLEELKSITSSQKEEFRQKVFSTVKVIFGVESVNYKKIIRVGRAVGIAGGGPRRSVPDYWSRDKEKFRISLKSMREELLLTQKFTVKEHVVVAKEHSVVTDEIENPLLEISDLPGVFYERLQEQINRSYYHEIYPAVDIFLRKFFENLIIDILRSKYGMPQVNLFYNESRNRHHDFSVLIQNFNSKLNDFKPLSQSLNDGFIRSLNKFRVIGNSRAHNIELSNVIVKGKIDENLKELTLVIEILVRLLNGISKTTEN